MRLTYLSLIGALMLPLLAAARGGGAPHATEQFPGAGHIYFADFGVFDATLDFESDEVLTFTTSAPRTETVQITAIRLRNKLWEVYWQEASGTTVVQRRRLQEWHGENPHHPPDRRVFGSGRNFDEARVIARAPRA